MNLFSCSFSFEKWNTKINFLRNPVSSWMKIHIYFINYRGVIISDVTELSVND